MVEGVASQALPLLRDRVDAGRELAHALLGERTFGPVVVGLARGGVQVAAEVAHVLEAPLDTVAVRKIGHPHSPEYGLGAVAAWDGVYVRASDGLSEEELAYVVSRARRSAADLDASLHREHPPIDLTDRDVVLVDDGLATGGTMIVALRWARTRGAARVVAAVPIAAAESLESIELEADDVVCPHASRDLGAVGLWYRRFEQLDDDDVRRLLAENRARSSAAPQHVRRDSVGAS